MRTGKRIYKKQFWLTKEEVDLLNEKVKKSNMNQSDFIRNAITNSIVKEKPDERFYNSIRNLRVISNNLNQIAKKANSLGFIDAKNYKKEVEKMDMFIDELRKEYLSN